MKALPVGGLALVLGAAGVGEVVELPPGAAVAGAPLDGDQPGLLEAGEEGIERASLDRAEPGVGQRGGDGVAVGRARGDHVQHADVERAAQPLRRPRPAVQCALP